MRAPCMTVAARVVPGILGRLKRRGGADLHVALPEVEAIEEEVRPAKLEVRLEEVVREVNSRAMEVLLGDETLEEGAGTLALEDVREERKALRVLGERLARGIGGEEAASVELLDSEQAPANIDYGAEAPSYTKTVRVAAADAGEGAQSITVKEGLKSYAGVPMASAYYEELEAGLGGIMYTEDRSESVKWACSADNGTLTLSGDLSASCPVFVVCYEASGRMLSAAVMRSSGASADVSGSARVTLIWADNSAGKMVPRCESVSFEL